MSVTGAEPEPIEDGLEKPKFLPPEVMEGIFSFVPTLTALNILPFVSKDVMAILKGPGAWRHLDGSKMEEISVADMNTLCTLANAKCQSLTCFAGFYYVSAASKYFRIPMDLVWPELVTLVVGSRVIGFKSDVLVNALSKGHFPSLKHLVISPCLDPENLDTVEKPWKLESLLSLTLSVSDVRDPEAGDFTCFTTVKHLRSLVISFEKMSSPNLTAHVPDKVVDLKLSFSKEHKDVTLPEVFEENVVPKG